MSIGCGRSASPRRRIRAARSKWRADYTLQLKNAGVQRVVILPDNDDPGRAHAEQVAVSCRKAGITAQIVALPNLPAHGDVSDWIDAGHTADDLHALVSLNSPTAQMPALVMTSIGDLLDASEEPVVWLVADRIAFGSVNLLAGKPKAGKSTLARTLGFSVARGRPWLGSDCVARPVWYFALEEKPQEVRRHFRQMGATKDGTASGSSGRSRKTRSPAPRAGRTRQAGPHHH